MNLGEKIKDIRLELGETMEEFGKRLNTSKGTVNNWEKGRNSPNRENLKIIAELANITVEQLLSDNYLFDIPIISMNDFEINKLDMMRESEEIERDEDDKLALLDAIQHLHKSNELINNLSFDFDHDNMMLFSYMYAYTNNMLIQLKNTIKSKDRLSEEFSRIMENDELKSDDGERVKQQILEWIIMNTAKNKISNELIKLNKDNQLTNQLKLLNINDATNIDKLIKLLEDLNIADKGLLDTLDNNIEY